MIIIRTGDIGENKALAMARPVTIGAKMRDSAYTTWECEEATTEVDLLG